MRRLLLLLALVAGAAWAALPSSGPISLTAIQTEFGGSNPASINEYYRSGGLVSNLPQNAAIPTSGQISLSNFYGTFAGGPNVSFAAGASNCVAAAPGGCNAQITVTRGGTVVGVPTSWSGSSNWYTPSTTAAGDYYYIKVTATSGTFTTNEMATCIKWNATDTAWRALVTRSGAAGVTTVVFSLGIYTDSGCTSASFVSTGNSVSAQVTP